MDTFIIGMAVRGTAIYYCAREKGLKMLNLSDKSKSGIITIPFYHLEVKCIL
jgi:hypothetical protein